jgi:hypothetical protein
LAHTGACIGMCGFQAAGGVAGVVEKDSMIKMVSVAEEPSATIAS